MSGLLRCRGCGAWRALHLFLVGNPGDSPAGCGITGVVSWPCRRCGSHGQPRIEGDPWGDG